MTDDLRLLEASRRGDRDAFGALVVRYQGLVSGITFNATGDLALSEEIAQQTFVTAWSRLRELREPGKFAAWLAGIARHRLRRDRRTRSRHPVEAREPGVMDQALAEHQPSPLDSAIRAEQSRLLWTVLEQLDEPHREALVLYYRAGKSVADVAEALGIHEEAARQRLARGRKKLRAEVERSIEESLWSSRPSTEFSSAVLAALPVGSAAAGTGALAAAAKAVAGKLPLLGAWLLGPLIGVAGAVFGVRCSLRAATSEEERRELWRLVGWSTLLTVLVTGTELYWAFGARELARSWPHQVLLWGSHVGLLLFLVVRGNRRLLAIRLRHEPGAPVAPGPGEATATPHPQGSVRAMRWNLVAALGGSTLWLVISAAIARDFVWAAIVVLALAGILRVAWRRAPAPEQVAAILRWNANALLANGAMCTAVVLLRWDAWSGSAERLAVLPRWQVLALLVAITAAVGIGLHWKARRLDRGDRTDA